MFPAEEAIHFERSVKGRVTLMCDGHSATMLSPSEGGTTWRPLWRHASGGGEFNPVDVGLTFVVLSVHDGYNLGVSATVVDDRPLPKLIFLSLSQGSCVATQFPLLVITWLSTFSHQRTVQILRVRGGYVHNHLSERFAVDRTQYLVRNSG